MANATVKAKNSQISAPPSEVLVRRSETSTQEKVSPPWSPTAQTVNRIATSINSEPAMVYKKNLIAA